MNRKFSRGLSLVLTMLMLFTFSACSGKGTKGGSDSSAGENTSEDGVNNGDIDIDINGGGTDVDNPADSNTGTGSSKSTNKTSSANQTSSGSPAVISVDSKGINLNGREIKIGLLAYNKASYEKTQLGKDKMRQIAAIESAYNCKIQLVNITDYNALRASITSGTPNVDIMNGGGPHLISGYMKGSMLQPLDDFGVISFNDSRWEKSVGDALTFNGKHYGVLGALQGFEKVQYNLVMYYNKSLLKRSSISDDLYALQKAGNWTWSALEGYAKQITDSSKGIIGFADNQFWGYNGLVTSNGSDWILKQNGKLVFSPDNANALEALEFYKNLVDVNALRVSNPNADRTKDMTDFLNGKVGFMVDYLERIQRGFPNMSDDFGVLYVPKGPKASDYKAQLNWFEFYSIPKGVKDSKNVAVILNEFGKPMYSADKDKQILESDSLQYVTDKGSLETIKGLASKSVLSESMKAPLQWDIDGKENSEGWFAYLYKIASGQQTAALAVGEVKDNFNKVLEDTWNIK